MIEMKIVILLVVLVQIFFAVGILGMIILKKYIIWAAERHFAKSLNSLEEKLRKKEITEATYQSCRYDIESIYRWKK